MLNSKLLKVFILFFTTSISSSVVNYFFQVYLAAKLGQFEFSKFTLLWSYFSFASIIGAFLTYWVSLNSMSDTIEKKYKKIVHFVALLSLLEFLHSRNSVFLVASIAIENIAIAFNMGRAIGLGDFKSINIINLSLAFIKFIILLILSDELINSISVFYVVIFSLILTQLISWYFLKHHDQLQNKPDQEKLPNYWVGPLVFSFLITTLPQIDIFWVHFFKNQETLTIVSELSFISKGLFYFQLIIAQWLFSRQKSNQDFTSLDLAKYILMFLVILFIGASVGAYLLPFLIHKFFAWPLIPSAAICFWCGISGGLMSIFYQVCQDSIIRKKIKQVVWYILFLGVTLLILGNTDASLINYYIISALIYMLIICSYILSIFRLKI